MNYCPICGSNEINTSGYCERHQQRIFIYLSEPPSLELRKQLKKLWGLYEGLKIGEEEIEEAKKSLFPGRKF